MKILLKEMHLEDFKGVSSAIYKFNWKSTFVSGRNGIGKTTIADAFFWLFADKSYELCSNPDIRPRDGRECVPCVKLLIEVEGKEVVVAKKQAIKFAKEDANGVRKVTLTNSYEINSVEKTERDFKAYLSDLGFEFEKFLQLSHPAMFVAGMNDKKLRDQMRNLLFSMADGMSDLEVAKLSKDTEKLADLLSNYTLQEVVAMNNSTLRKIKENYGKSGEILRANIAGLEKAKTGIDISEMELGKNAVIEEIERLKSQMLDTQKAYDNYLEIGQGALSLKFKLSDMQRDANAENEKRKYQIKAEKGRLEEKLKNIDSRINILKGCVEANLSENTTLEEKRGEKLAEWRKVSAMIFDESTTICTYCGQPLPLEKAQELRDSFESNKNAELNKIIKDGNMYKESILENKSEIETYIAELNELNGKSDAVSTQIADLAAELESIPSNVDITSTKEYKEIEVMIAEKEKIMEECRSCVEEIKIFDRKMEELNLSLKKYENEIAKASNDVAIEEKIELLKAKQGEYEQMIASCECILEQVKIVSQKKNELLTDKINEKFDVVKWMLFDYQKNGEYKEVCIPTIDGKKFGTHTNTGLEVLAKLDIVKGLQKFFEQYYPVFLDGAERLDKDAMKSVAMDSQIIMLCVADNDLEITEV